VRAGFRLETTWNTFSGFNAEGTILFKGQPVSVSRKANYNLNASPSIDKYPAFIGFNENLPNSTLLRTTWSAGQGGVTTLCFSQSVNNPVLVLSSLGWLPLRSPLISRCLMLSCTTAEE
jgi:hypothetical protein